MIRVASRLGTSIPILDRLGSTRSGSVVRGWLAVSTVLIVLGVLLYGGWVVAGGGVRFLLVVAALFVLLLVYSVRTSQSVASAMTWFTDPEGILLLALGFAFVVVLVTLVL